jgi:hypothetical protein
MGFNSQKHIESVLGDKLQRPLQKFHGSQIENLFKEQDAIWQRDPLKSAIEALKHPAAKGCTDDGTLAIVPISIYIPILD